MALFTTFCHLFHLFDQNLLCLMCDFHVLPNLQNSQPMHLPKPIHSMPPICSICSTPSTQPICSLPLTIPVYSTPPIWPTFLLFLCHLTIPSSNAFCASYNILLLLHVQHDSYTFSASYEFCISPMSPWLDDSGPTNPHFTDAWASFEPIEPPALFIQTPPSVQITSSPLQETAKAKLWA